jgi:hypothetical protein
LIGKFSIFASTKASEESQRIACCAIERLCPFAFSIVLIGNVLVSNFFFIIFAFELKYKEVEVQFKKASEEKVKVIVFMQ